MEDVWDTCSGASCFGLQSGGSQFGSATTNSSPPAEVPAWPHCFLRMVSALGTGTQGLDPSFFYLDGGAIAGDCPCGFCLAACARITLRKCEAITLGPLGAPLAMLQLNTCQLNFRERATRPEPQPASGCCAAVGSADSSLQEFGQPAGSCLAASVNSTLGTASGSRLRACWQLTCSF